MIEAPQGVLAVPSIGIREQRVLPVDQHRPDPVACEIQSRDLRDTVLEVDFPPPGLLELGLVGRIGYRLEAGIVVGQRSAVAGPLNVVLPAHRIDARALAADVSCHQHEVAKTLDVVDAADVLRDAQRVVDGASVGLAVYAGGLLDIGCRNLRDGLSPFGREFTDVLEKRFAPGGALCDENGIDEAVPYDHMGHGQQQCHV